MRHTSTIECDPIMDKKSPIFQLVAQRAGKAVFSFKSHIFKNRSKSHQIFGLLLRENFSYRTLKNRPIWSRWLAQFKRYHHRLSFPLTFPTIKDVSLAINLFFLSFYPCSDFQCNKMVRLSLNVWPITSGNICPTA